MFNKVIILAILLNSLYLSLGDSLKGIEVPCNFSCKNGGKPTPKPNYTPVVNGCGSFNFNFDFSIIKLEEFNGCCNKHDYCYRTCNTVKKDCDTDFLRCLEGECKNRWGRGLISSITDKIKLKACEELGEKMYDTVKYVGCLSYLLDQERGCDCL